MEFDYLNYVTSKKLKKVNDKYVKPTSNLILKIRVKVLFLPYLSFKTKKV